MDEMIEIIYGLGRGDYFGFAGEFYQLRPIKLTPVPTMPVPILIGGHADVALRRAARLCDGWISAGGSIEELAQMVDKLHHYRAEYGRAQLPFAIQSMGSDSFTIEGIRRLADLGVDETIVGFRNSYAGGPDHRTLEQMIGEIDRYADTIIHKVRA